MSLLGHSGASPAFGGRGCWLSCEDPAEVCSTPTPLPAALLAVKVEAGATSQERGRL